MNTLGDALQKAFDAKKKDFSSFIWKGEKRKEGSKFVQDSKRMIDMTPEELKKCYNRCEVMLHNNNPKNLGRFNVLEEVAEQISKCNVELLLRYCENVYKHNETRSILNRHTLMISIREFINDHREITNWRDISFSEIAENLPEEFKDITIGEVLDACIDNLGAFSKQHLTMTFITKMGLWFTKAEENELKGETNSTAERLRIAKERLKLPTKLVLTSNEKGLSFHEMRAMLTLPKKQKYSDMTTEQLITLKNKVLFRYLNEVDKHISSWNRLKRQLELVAKDRGVSLTDDLN